MCSPVVHAQGDVRVTPPEPVGNVQGEVCMGACLRSHVHHAGVVHRIWRRHMALVRCMHHLRLFWAPAMQHRTGHLHTHNEETYTHHIGKGRDHHPNRQRGLGNQEPGLTMQTQCIAEQPKIMVYCELQKEEGSLHGSQNCH